MTKRRANIRTCRAIIFDWDGVIVDSFPIALRAYVHLFKKRGLVFDSEILRTRFGIGMKQVIQDFLDLKRVNYTQKMLDTLEQEKIQFQLTLTPETPLLRGVTESIPQFAQHYTLAIASSNDRRIIESLLSYHALRKYFSIILASNDVSRVKPFPDIFLKAADAMNMKPADCIVLEDSLTGVRAARAAGMYVVGVSTGSTPFKVLQAEADRAVKSLKEFAAMIT